MTRIAHMPFPEGYKPPTAKQIAAEKKRYQQEEAEAFKKETIRQGERVNYLLDTVAKHPLVKQMLSNKLGGK